MDDMLYIYSSGGLRFVNQGKQVVGFVSQKTQLLLLYLAYSRSPQRRKILAERLFPFSEPDQAATNLRVALNSLKQQLAPYLTTSRLEIGINDDAKIWLDVDVIEATIHAAKLEAQRAHSFSQAAVELFEEALTLYKGDFLEGYLFDAVRTEDSIDRWVELQRKRLRYLMVEALDYVVEYDLLTGDHSGGIAWLTLLLQLDPSREKSYRQMMLFLARMGLIEDALCQYETYQGYLLQKARKPSAELTSFYEQLRCDPQTAAFATGRSPIPVQNDLRQASDALLV